MLRLKLSVTPTNWVDLLKMKVEKRIAHFETKAKTVFIAERTAIAKRIRFKLGAKKFDKTGSRVSMRTGKLYASIKEVSTAQTEEIRIEGKFNQLLFGWMDKGLDKEWEIEGNPLAMSIKTLREPPRNKVSRSGKGMVIHATLVDHPGIGAHGILDYAIPDGLRERVLRKIKK